MELQWKKPSLRIKRISKNAKIPTFGTRGAACFDIYSTSDGVLNRDAPSIIFSTGLCFDVPEYFALMIYSRSGQAFNNDVRLANCVGVIDSDFRGEVMIKLTLDGLGPVEVRKGDRIAQAMLTPLVTMPFIEVDELSETARGEGGFGSTGA